MKVIPAFESLIKYSKTLNQAEQAKNEKLAYFINEYFVKNYIGKEEKDGQRKQPRFAINLWNVHESTMNGMFF